MANQQKDSESVFTPELLALLDYLKNQNMNEEHTQVSTFAKYIDNLSDQLKNLEAQLESLNQALYNMPLKTGKEEGAKIILTNTVKDITDSKDGIKEFVISCKNKLAKLASDFKNGGVNAFKKSLMALKADELLLKCSKMLTSVENKIIDCKERTAVLNDELKLSKVHKAKAIETLTGKIKAPKAEKKNFLDAFEKFFAFTAEKIPKWKNECYAQLTKFDKFFIPVTSDELDYIRSKDESIVALRLNNDNLIECANLKEYEKIYSMKIEATSSKVIEQKAEAEPEAQDEKKIEAPTVSEAEPTTAPEAEPTVESVQNPFTLDAETISVIREMNELGYTPSFVENRPDNKMLFFEDKDGNKKGFNDVSSIRQFISEQKGEKVFKYREVTEPEKVLLEKAGFNEFTKSDNGYIMKYPKADEANVLAALNNSKSMSI